MGDKHDPAGLERHVDYVVMGRFSAVVPIRDALEQNGMRVVMIVGGEQPEYVARIIRASAQGVITVGLAPALGDKVVIEALVDVVRSERKSILIPDESQVSASRPEDISISEPQTGVDLPAEACTRSHLSSCRLVREEEVVLAGPVIIDVGPQEPPSNARLSTYEGVRVGQQEVVTLPSYYIDRYPVRNIDYNVFVEATGYEAEGVPGWGSWRDYISPAKEQHPVVALSWQDMWAFIEWSGRALPMETQWVKAARFQRAMMFPWGDSFDDRFCNASGSDTTPVQAFPRGVSQCGCYDMSGNVWEVVIDPRRLATMGKDGWIPENPDGPYFPRILMLKGGSFGCVPRECACSFRGNIDASTKFDRVGFRTVR